MPTILDFLLSEAFKHVAGTSGGEFAGPCPKCGGTDRFRLWPHKGATGKFWCRGCGWSGDGIQFLRDLDGLSYPEACRRFGTTPRPGQRSFAPRQKGTWAPKPSVLPCGPWQATAGAFVEFATGVMATCAEGQAYALRRGLTPETIRACRIGWNPVTVYDPRESWGLPPELNPETGRPRRVWLPAGLVVPTWRAGCVVALKIRRPDWHEGERLPKYAGVIGGSGGPLVLSGAAGKPVAVVEGELDAFLIHQAGGDLVTSVAIRSAKNKPDAEAHALLTVAPVILCALDADDAGYEGWLWWQAHYPQVRRWRSLEGKDPGESMKAGLDLREWIMAGLSPEPEAEPVRHPAGPKDLPAWAY